MAYQRWGGVVLIGVLLLVACGQPAAMGPSTPTPSLQPTSVPQVTATPQTAATSGPALATPTPLPESPTATEPSVSLQPLIGHWEGTVLGEEREVKVTVDFVSTGDDGLEGFITIPPGHSSALGHLSYARPDVRFELRGHPEGYFLSFRTYTGKLEGDTVSGHAQSNNESAPFTLRRTEARADYRTLEVGLPAVGIDQNLMTLEHDGVVRRFQALLPAGFDRESPYPVLFWFHGGYGTGHSGHEALAPLVNREGFVGVFPDAFGPWWHNIRCDDVGESCEEMKAKNAASQGFSTRADDVGFVEAILDWLATWMTVDEARVYGLGFSGGASMVKRLGQESGRFAAIVPIGGGHLMEGEGIAPRLSPVSVMYIYGQQDRGYDGASEFGVVFLPIKETVAQWATYNECAGPQADTSQSGITVYRYAGCGDSREVVLYTVHEGRHWPARGPDERELDPPGNLHELAWEFFERNPRTR